MGNISMSSVIGLRLALPRAFCLAAVRQTLANTKEGRVSQHALGATSRSRRVRGSHAARDRDLDAHKPDVSGPRPSWRCHTLLIIQMSLSHRSIVFPHLWLDTRSLILHQKTHLSILYNDRTTTPHTTTPILDIP